MVKNETLHIRVNEDVKINAEKTLNVLGISISEAVNIFLHQIPLVGGLPFDVRVPFATESAIIRSNEDLYDKLGVGMEQIKNGKVIGAEEVMLKLRNKYGFQG